MPSHKHKKAVHPSNHRKVHPLSRKARKMNKEALRSDKMARQKLAANKVLYQRGLRFDAFRSMILEDQGKPAYSHDEVVELILAYIHRDDEEIEELKQGKQTPSTRTRQVALETRRDADLSELHSGQGFEAPDLCNPEMVAKLIEWDGELSKLHGIRAACFKRRPEADAAAAAAAAEQ